MYNYLYSQEKVVGGVEMDRRNPRLREALRIMVSYLVDEKLVEIDLETGIVPQPCTTEELTPTSDNGNRNESATHPHLHPQESL